MNTQGSGGSRNLKTDGAQLKAGGLGAALRPFFHKKNSKKKSNAGSATASIWRVIEFKNPDM